MRILHGIAWNADVSVLGHIKPSVVDSNSSSRYKVIISRDTYLVGFEWSWKLFLLEPSTCVLWKKWSCALIDLHARTDSCISWNLGQINKQILQCLKRGQCNIINLNDTFDARCATEVVCFSNVFRRYGAFSLNIRVYCFCCWKSLAFDVLTPC